MRSSSSVTPTLLTFQNETIDNPNRIKNISNNYFITVGKMSQAKIKYSYENYTDYFTNPNSFFFFLTGKE